MSSRRSVVTRDLGFGLVHAVRKGEVPPPLRGVRDDKSTGRPRTFNACPPEEPRIPNTCHPESPCVIIEVA